MQRDFLEDDGFYSKRPHDICTLVEAKHKIEKIIKKLYKKIPIVYVVAEYEYEQFGKGLAICIKGTKGQEIVLDKKFATQIFTKHQYSAFSSNDYTQFLIEKKIKAILLSGVLTEYCIRATALDGINNGFKLYLIEDCIANGRDVVDKHKATIKELLSKGAILINSNDIADEDRLHIY